MVDIQYLIGGEVYMKVKYIGQGVRVIWADGEKIVLRPNRVYELKDPFYTYLKNQGVIEDYTE
jgi:hypothetical protein